MKLDYDVAIVGGGPAGSVLARLLAVKNYKVLLINDNYQHRLMTVGETFSPASRPILMRLNIENNFESNHLKSYGNQSCWGTPDLNDIDFIFSRFGHGWHLDREVFNDALRNDALNSGVNLLNDARLEKINKVCSHWELAIRGKEPIYCNSRFIVDASGRSRWVLRKLNINITQYDDLVGFASLFTNASKKDKDTRTLIEAVKDGWWYSALLPSKDRVVIFFTDTSTGLSSKMIVEEEFRSMLLQTTFIKSHLAKFDYTMSISPSGRPANSSKADQAIGDDWLAVGDAVMAFDPLSSQGIITAIESAEIASKTIDQILSGDHSTKIMYQRFVNDKYDKYLKEYQRYYSQENRWENEPFWKKRIQLQLQEIEREI